LVWADDNDNFDDDNNDGGSDFTVHEEYEADQYTFVGRKGQQRIKQMAEIQKIITLAGWLDQCPGGPPSMDFAELKLKNYHLHNGMLLFRKNVSRSC